ncbi:MAG: hypothetical protein R3C49_13455 [Planctomycetaceae bacterium]
MPTFSHHGLRLLLAGAFVLFSPSLAQCESIEDAVKKIKDRVELYLKSEGQNQLLIETFKAAKSSPNVNTKLFENQIREALKAGGLVTIQTQEDVVAGEVNWSLKGVMSVEVVGDVTETRVTLELLDGEERPLTSFNSFYQEREAEDALAQAKEEGTTPPSKPQINDRKLPEVKIDVPQDVPSLVGTNVDVQTPVQALLKGNVDVPAPKADTPEKTQELAKATADVRAIAQKTITAAIKSPSFHRLTNSEISASADSKFTMKISKSRNPDGPFQDAEVVDLNGRAFVRLQEGDYFRVHVVNRNSFDVGLELLLDGINSLHFAENKGTRESGKWFIAAESSGVVDGWFKKLGPGGITKFMISAEPDGVAASLGLNSGIGKIQANFYMALPVNRNTPLPIFVAASSKGAVAQGPPANFGGGLVKRDFSSGIPLACITVLHTHPEPSDVP